MNTVDKMLCDANGFDSVEDLIHYLQTGER